jgi:hypothetical protein
MSKIIPFDPKLPKANPRVVLHRTELNKILSVYGHMVASGKARDYAIDMLEDRAVFSMYRHAAERPTWRIEKIPALARKQGEWVISGMSGQVLKRGHDLKQVLRVFERFRMSIVD